MCVFINLEESEFSLKSEQKENLRLFTPLKQVIAGRYSNPKFQTQSIVVYGHELSTLKKQDYKLPAVTISKSVDSSLITKKLSYRLKLYQMVIVVCSSDKLVLCAPRALKDQQLISKNIWSAINTLKKHEFKYTEYHSMFI